MPDRRISVVVPSYNRAAYLRVLLRSLTWSSVPPEAFEVVVVNDGGGDDLPGVVDAWRGQGLDVRLVTLRTDGAPRNNARARNAGLAVARYPIVLQTDPDIVFVADVLAAVRDAVDGRSIHSCDGYFPLTREATDTLVFAAAAPPVTPGALRRAAEGRPNQVCSPDGVGGLHGAFACATQVLRDLGGYDESFEHWGWEDRELLVTAASRGLTRRVMPDTMVTHLWHPPMRGSLGREELAVVQHLSRAAWDVQMQRVAAEYPRRHRPRPASRGEEAAAGPLVPFGMAAFDRWRAPDDDERLAAAIECLERGALDDARVRLPRAYQMCFDALAGEAEALRAAGHLALARDVLCYALRRPWEPSVPAGARDFDRALPCEVAGPSDHAPLALYDRVDAVLERLALCEDALGRAGRRDQVLSALEDVEGGAPRAAAVRARLALGHGDLRAASRLVATLPEAGLSADHLSLRIECLLLSGQAEAARTCLDAAPGTAEWGDYFARLRRAAYARHLAPDTAWLEADAEAARERSEFLFSAGVRSERAGLDLAACLLFGHFLDLGGPAEPRLRTECVTRIAAAVARVARLAGPDAAERLCGRALARSAAQAR